MRGERRNQILISDPSSRPYVGERWSDPDADFIFFSILDDGTKGDRSAANSWNQLLRRSDWLGVKKEREEEEDLLEQVGID